MTWEAKKERQLARKATIGNRKAPAVPTPPAKSVEPSDAELEQMTAPALPPTPPAKPGKR